MFVNFDNAATTYPKPQAVKNAVAQAMDQFGGNSGRGGHPLAMRTSRAMYSARSAVADLFGAQPENVIFTLNCTHALNLAIHGIMRDGGHLIISSLEHNSAARPGAQLAMDGKISLSIAQIAPDTETTLRNFRKLIRPDTKAVVCTIASNVTGQITPWKEIGQLCREHDICFIADGAQGCGVIPIDLSEGINILCTAGHKGLYGITGTGLLVTDGKYKIFPIIQGGTGSASMSLRQPDILPDSLESGTPCIIGAMSVMAGIRFIRSKGIDNIFAHEDRICRSFIRQLEKNENIIIYRDPVSSYVPIVSFNIRGIPSEELAQELADQGYCLRAGFHCAALAHTQLGTKTGAVRFAPSVFSSERDGIILANIINNIAFQKKL